MSVKPLFRLAWQTTRIAVLLALLLGAVFVPTQTARALTFTVNTTADTVDASPGNGVCADASSQCSLRAAITEANALAGADTINLPAGTYQLTRANAGGVNEDGNSTGDLDINASLTITGAGAGSTIIQAGTNTSDGIDKVLGVNPYCYSGVSVTIQDVTIRYGRNTQPYGAADYSYTGGGLDWCGGTGSDSFTLQNAVVSNNTNVNGYGGGLNIDSLSGYTGTITIDTVTFQNNRTTGTINDTGGGALNVFGDRPNITISNSTFTNNQVASSISRGGAIFLGPRYGGSVQIHNSLIDGNTTNSDGGGIAISSFSSSTTITIDQNTRILNNTAGRYGGGIHMFVGTAFNTTPYLLSHLLISGNTATGDPGGGIYIDGINTTVQYSRIVNNTASSGTGLQKVSASGTVTAQNNWWGCSTGPGDAPCDRAFSAGGTLTYTPWLRDELTAASGTTLVTNQTSALTASFLTDSAGGAVTPPLTNLGQIIGLPISWGASSGSASGAATVGAGGTASGTFQATAVGSATVYARVDNDNTAPVSSNVLNFTVNTANTTTAITSDLPDPSTSGQAVTVIFTVTGQYGNTPTAPTGNVTVTDGVDSCTGTVAAGSCNITLTTPGARTLTATYAGDTNFNGSTSAGASHTVNQAPAITSADNITFTVGAAGSFTVMTTGYPTGASMLISESGALPAGVAFADNGDGTATLAGTPAAGTGGAYPLTITASNGVAPDATQNFTLNVNQAPAITSANTTTFAETLAGSFTVTTSGFPTGASMTISEVGALPSGVTFTDNGDGTATLAGTPALGTMGNYPITITAANGTLPNATQNFTLVVETNLHITSANNTTFTVGSAGSFTVTTIGVPIPTLSRSGSLPSGVTFVDNGDGTGTLSGTPAAGTAGTYPITFTASNGVAPNYVQNFTLTVNQAPAITSVNNTTFTIGGAGTFTVTTTGFPTGASMSISEVGALPGGITFTDNGDGTATLAGTPGAGTVGTYPLTITASNGVAPDATQNFTLTVNQAATNTTITSDTPDPSVVGQVVTFNYTVSAVPPGGGTPAGNVTVSNGTDNCTGTVAAGSCNITFTAPATSNFTATYAGNANYAGSTSAIEAHTVNQAATTTAITSDAPDASVVGQTVTFNYTVGPVLPGTGTPTGNVTISNGTESCTGTVAAGSCPITFTAPGTTNFTATYAGDASFAGSTSAIESHTVNQASTTTSITSDLPDPSLVGQSVTVNFGVAVVAPGAGTPTGNVTVSDGINNCVGTVATGACNITLTTTGARTLTATYAGNANFSGSASVGEPHTVNQAPAITSTNSTGFTVGAAGSFTITTTGYPISALTQTGTLPTGVTFTDNGNGTATLAGTPAAGTNGIYNLTFTASNGVLPNAAQNFTLTVGEAPAFTNANNTFFIVGSAVSFTVTTNGYPVPAITRTGALPTGVTLTDNGDGTATFAGIPAAGTSGVYNLIFTASNGVLPDATQNFTLTINESPAITSADNTTFTIGTAGNFTVTTTGYPVPAIAQAGALPTGVTFTDNGDGTATLAGTPAAGTNGIYNLTFTASNGILPNATQSFSLTVNQAPAFTNANNTFFTTGVPGTFTMTTTGYPVPAITQTGALPAGMNFVDNGNGTATLNGTPNAGTGGVYNLTLTANNGVTPNATQNFTLTINEAPAITSANNTGFTVGAAGSFTVTTSGYPDPGITQSGALPGGVSFTDNGNGTATLSGTPAAGSGGTYNLTFTANNGITPNATQNFTLTVGQAPAITSPNNVTFVAGNLSSFTITTTGSPTPAITRSGALPSGITFTDNGNGTATLAGTPTLGSVGTYNLIFTAQNGTTPNATQNFTLTINGPPGVARINSSADTGDGQIDENEHTSVAITQLLVVFNKDMNADTPGDLDDVLTVANYSLVQGVSTVIPINGVITYNAATDTATLDVNGGVALPNGRYTLTVEGRIEDTLGAPIGTNFTRIFYVDSGYPYPTSIITVQNNATITNGATINVSFSSLNITFNEDVSNAGGGAGIDDVTNPLNYLLLQTGPNGAYDTANCQAFATNANAPLGDDIRIPTGTVTYANNGGTGPFVATVPLNAGTALPNGIYRLLICGTTSIVDLAGNALNGGADSQIDFTILILDSVKSNPKTGFAPGVVTVLPEQPADKAYADLGNLWIEIPSLKLKTSITGVPLKDGGWDVTWLNSQVGWLEGTAYPTWEGNTVLTAHGYTADGEAGPFALLQYLKYGDTIIIHLGGMKYTYTIRANLLIKPNDTRLLTKHEKLDWITLITCQQYDEKTKSYRYRRVVRAVLIQVDEE